MMKTRQEMVYDFMIALAAGVDSDNPFDDGDATYIRKSAERLADEYIKHISGN
jgi:hypothetical protein